MMTTEAILRKEIETKGYTKIFDQLVKRPMTKEQEKEIYCILQKIGFMEESYLFKLHRRVYHYEVVNEASRIKTIQKMLSQLNKERAGDDVFWGNLSENLCQYPLGEVVVGEQFLSVREHEIVHGKDVLLATFKVLLSKENTEENTLFNWLDEKPKLPKEDETIYWREILKELRNCFLIPSQEKKILLVLSELQSEDTLTLNSVRNVWLIRVVRSINQWQIGYPIHHTLELLSIFVKKYQYESWSALFDRIVPKTEFLSENQIMELLGVFGGFSHKNPLYLYVCKKYSDKELTEDLFDQWVKPLQIRKPSVIESPSMQLQRWKKEHKEWAFKKIEKEEKTPLNMMLMDFMNGDSIEKIISNRAFEEEYNLYKKTPQAASGGISVIRKYCDFYFTRRPLLKLSIHGRDVKWVKLEISQLKSPEFNVFARQRSSLFIAVGTSYQLLNYHPKATFVSFPVLETEDVSFEGFMKTIELPVGWKNLDLKTCYHQVKKAFFPDKVQNHIFLKLFHIWVVFSLIKFTGARTFAFIDDQTYSPYFNKILHILCNKKVNIKEKDEVLEFLEQADIQKRLRAHKEILGVQKMRLEES